MMRQQAAGAARLRDGTPVWTRPLVPADRDALVQAFDRLSERSRYERFLVPMSALPPHWVHRLVDEVDGVRHVALVLMAGDVPVGVGRFVRERARPERAELAVTVSDAWQGRGAGTVLVERLADEARALGVRTFTATLHHGNAASYRMLRHAGRVERRHAGGGVLEVEVELDPPPGASAR